MKKKKQRTLWRFTCPIFCDDIYLLIGDKDKANAFCNELDLTDKHLGKCAEMVDAESEIPSGFMIWVRSAELYYTLVHECLHLTNKIFGNHGVPFNETNDEIIAYYQNYWIRKFWYSMSKEINKGKESKMVNYGSKNGHGKGKGMSGGGRRNQNPEPCGDGGGGIGKGTKRSK